MCWRGCRRWRELEIRCRHGNGTAERESACAEADQSGEQHESGDAKQHPPAADNIDAGLPQIQAAGQTQALSLVGAVESVTSDLFRKDGGPGNEI